MLRVSWAVTKKRTTVGERRRETSCSLARLCFPNVPCLSYKVSHQGNVRTHSELKYKENKEIYETNYSNKKCIH
jgi:hypothetical protein